MITFRLLSFIASALMLFLRNLNIQVLIGRISDTHPLLKNLSLLFILHLSDRNKLYRILNLQVEQFSSSLISFSGLQILDFPFLYFFIIASFHYFTTPVSRLIFLMELWLVYFCLSLFLFLFPVLYSQFSKVSHPFIHLHFFIIPFFPLLALILIITFVISTFVFKFLLLSL